MAIKIIGIDASLSSTGFAVARCNFNEENKDFLFKLLTEKRLEDISKFKDCFEVILATEIHEDKEVAKKLAKVRKSIRDSEKENKQPKLEDNVLEEKLSTQKIQDQVNAIMKLVQAENKDKENALVFIEDYSYHSAGSITQLAEMKGVLKVEMKEKQRFIYLTSNINTVKKIGSKNGNASKELMCEEIKRFGFKSDIKLDDLTDALAVALAGYYTVYHRLFPFVVPGGLKAKERKYLQSFIDSLELFANRVGSTDELKALL